MSEPDRWSDGAADAPPGALDLLSSASAPPTFDSTVLARSAARLTAATSATAVPGTAAMAPWKWLVGGGVGIASVALVLNLTLPRATPSTTNTHRAQPVTQPTVAPLRAPEVATVIPNPAPVTATPQPAAAPPSATPVAPTTVPEISSHTAPVRTTPSATSAAHVPAATRQWESELLEQARAAVEARQASHALQLLRQHAQEFPRSNMAEEREAIAVRALVRAGRNAEALRRGETFLQRYPRGIYSDSVRRQVEAIPR